MGILISQWMEGRRSVARCRSFLIWRLCPLRKVSVFFFLFSSGPDSEVLFVGYRLTETCGMCAFLLPELLTYGPVGVPAPCVEIKFVDCPDLGYFSSADPSSSSSPLSSSLAQKANLPQGEILLRGESVTKGYFGREDLNADESVFTKDGWFRTGDIGQWNEDGTLSVIDRYVVRLRGPFSVAGCTDMICVARLKNLVKMQSGKVYFQLFFCVIPAEIDDFFKTFPPSVHRPRTSRSTLQVIQPCIEPLRTRILGNDATHRDHLPARAKPATHCPAPLPLPLLLPPLPNPHSPSNPPPDHPQLQKAAPTPHRRLSPRSSGTLSRASSSWTNVMPSCGRTGLRGW